MADERIKLEKGHKSGACLWFVESLRVAISKDVPLEVLQKAEDLIAKNSNGTPQISAGLFSLRLHNPKLRNQKESQPRSSSGKKEFLRSQDLQVEIRFDPFSEASFEKIASQVVTSAISYARLLCGYLPNEIREMFKDGDSSLDLTTISNLVSTIDGKPFSPVSVEIVASLLVLIVELERDPTSLFLLYGMQFAEFLQKCREARKKMSRREFVSEVEHSSSNHSVENILDRNSFWLAKSDICRFSYDIKADELPAAILKRLDSLPLGGIEDEIDLALEDAYIQIARRAQAYGLGANY